MAKCKERKGLPIVSKFLPKNSVVYKTEIHGTVLEQPIRIEYIIKQKPRGALAGKQDRINGLHGRGRYIATTKCFHKLLWGI